jgi:di/tricarboxylate transporter
MLITIIFLLKVGGKMIPIYEIENLTGGVDIMFQNVMRIGFIITVILLTIWIIVSLLIWLFRSQK